MRIIVYVGMDVHKDTFNLCAYDPNNGEILAETHCASKAEFVENFIDNLSEKCDPKTEFITGYEAGCLGYSLYYDLHHRNIQCIILAPSTMYSSAKHKMVKNDRMDARMIATNLANNTYQSVYVPDQDDIEVKELIRQRRSFKKFSKQAKQQFGSFLLRHNWVYNQNGGKKSKWTKEHIAWIKALPATGLYQPIIANWLAQLNNYNNIINDLDAQIEAISHTERYEESTHRIECLKGIKTTSAMDIVIETANFERFPNAKAYMSYVGLTSSEHSSGGHTSHGALTKQGNSVIRATLIESAHSLLKGRFGIKSKQLISRQKGESSEVILYADHAIKRLQTKYQNLIESGKAKNVAVSAIARELAGFIWGLETNHISY